MVEINSKYGIGMCPQGSSNVKCNSIFIDCADNVFKIKNYAGSVVCISASEAVAANLDPVKEDVLENSMQIVNLSYCMAIADIPHSYMVVDMFSSAGGYSASINTGLTTSIWGVDNYKPISVSTIRFNDTTGTLTCVLCSVTAPMAVGCFCNGACAYGPCVGNACIVLCDTTGFNPNCYSEICIVGCAFSEVHNHSTSYAALETGTVSWSAAGVSFSNGISIQSALCTTCNMCSIGCLKLVKVTDGCFEVYCNGVCLCQMALSCVNLCTNNRACATTFYYTQTYACACLRTCVTGYTNCICSIIKTNLKCFDTPVQGIYYTDKGNCYGGSCIRIDVRDCAGAIIGCDIAPNVYQALTDKTKCCMVFDIKQCACAICMGASCIKSYGIAVETL